MQLDKLQLDEIWDEFVAWWKSRWAGSPDKISVEEFLKWYSARLKQVDWKWDFKENVETKKTT